LALRFPMAVPQLPHPFFSAHLSAALAFSLAAFG